MGKENTPPTCRQGPVRNLESSFSSVSSQSTLENESRTSTISTTLREQANLHLSHNDKQCKPILRSNTFKIKDMEAKQIMIPTAAMAPLHMAAWTKLSALAKGFLTRKLLNTEKVKELKRTIQETLSCAVQLHLEATGTPGKQDVELHARLLAQLETACRQIHDIFFRIDTTQRMALLAADRAARRAKAERRETSKMPTKRISAATAARLASKTSSTSSDTAQFETRRRKAILTSKPGIHKSPRMRMVRSIYSSTSTSRSVCSSSNPSSLMSRSVSSLGSSNKPSWK